MSHSKTLLGSIASQILQTNLSANSSAQVTLSLNLGPLFAIVLCLSAMLKGISGQRDVRKKVIKFRNLGSLKQVDRVDVFADYCRFIELTAIRCTILASVSAEDLL